MLIKQEIFSPYVIKATSTGFEVASLSKSGKNYENIKSFDDLNMCVMYIAHLKAINSSEEMSMGEYQYFMHEFTNSARNSISEYVKQKEDSERVQTTEDENESNEVKSEVVDNVQQTENG